LAGVDCRWLVVPLGLALVGLLLVGKYGQVVAVLRYLLLGFLAFPRASRLVPRPQVQLRSRALVASRRRRRRPRPARYDADQLRYVWETIGRGREEAPDDTASDQGLARAKIGAVFTAVILWFMLVASAAALG
jgi:hypothetical protein